MGQGKEGGFRGQAGPAPSLVGLFHSCGNLAPSLQFSTLWFPNLRAGEHGGSSFLGILEVDPWPTWSPHSPCRWGAGQAPPGTPLSLSWIPWDPTDQTRHGSPRGLWSPHPLPPDLKATKKEMTVAVQMTASDHRETADSPLAPEIETDF